MMSYKLLDAPGIENGKMLAVKGDNVMQGYMRPEHPLVLEAPQNGWYETGDIVQIDEDGFITILGRLKRFAKIAGEMVSISAVEDILDKLSPNAKQGVIALSDDKKGEKLILITNDETLDLPKLKAFFKTQNLSELWCPKKVVYMKNPPFLGNGKFDYQTACQMFS